MSIVILGVDLGKNSCSVVGVDAAVQWLPDGPSTPLRVNAMPGFVRPDTTPLASWVGECGQILETLKGLPPSYRKLQIHGLVLSRLASLETVQTLAAAR